MSLLSFFRDTLDKRQAAKEQAALTELKARYHAFRIFLENNGKALELIVAIEALISQHQPEELQNLLDELLTITAELIDGLNLLAEDHYTALFQLHGRMARSIQAQFSALVAREQPAPLTLALAHIQAQDHLLTGSKAFHLAMLKQAGMPVPDGFVCTTRACRQYLVQTGLLEQITPLIREVEIGKRGAESAAQTIRTQILATPLPEGLATALHQALTDLGHRIPEGQQALAVSVRSSGVAEDSAQRSFAGQFASLLNIRTPAGLLHAFQEVIASAYSGRAIAYRMHTGLAPGEFDLAVLCQHMVVAKSAGVLFTRDPAQPDSQRMLISAVPGLGTLAVSGSAPADLYRPLRQEALQKAGQNEDVLFSEAVIAHKTIRETPAKEEGLEVEQVPAEQAQLPLLTASQLQELRALGHSIEAYGQGPQDIEWAYSQANGLCLLQARPLHIGPQSSLEAPASEANCPVICRGTCAAPGRIIGTVCLAHSTAELAAVRQDFAIAAARPPAILVLPNSIVEAAELLPHCAGVIVDIGNPTDHLSCLAREYGIPMLTGTHQALQQLQTDQWIVLDANAGVVCETGELSPDDHLQVLATKTQQPTTAHKPLTPAQQALRQLIVPLNLTSTFGTMFSPFECRSLHDLIRYSHEVAVLTMFKAGDQVMEDAGGLLHRLELDVPFSFLVIDVGGGVRRPRGPRKLRHRLTGGRPLGKGDILSAPLAALCEGLTTPGLSWHPSPDTAALQEIMSRGLLDSREVRPAGSFNYALAARDYLNLNTRVEYHFAMIDAVCGRDHHANYIRFRFKGGAAGQDRSHRRVRFLQLVLEHVGFYSTINDDLITASLSGLSRERTYEQMVIIGRLLGFSRFLDGVMTSEQTPSFLANQFLAGQYDVTECLSELPAAHQPEAQA